MHMVDDPKIIGAIERGHCPDCGHRGFVLGPQGGMAFNCECGGCRNRFNVTRWMGVTAFVQRIPSVAEGGVMWASEPTRTTQ
jgi:hypothetical protein